LPELGTADTVAALSRRRLVDHYRRYYGVAGLTIAVVGNVTPARVVAKIQSLLGDGGAAPDSAPIPVEPARSEGIEVFRAMPSDDAQVVIGYPGTTLRDPDRFSLEVLAEILSGPSGRLAAAFRDQRPFVRGSSARSFAGIDPGSVAIAFQCRSQNLEPSVAAARAELARVVERGVTADEVGRARLGRGLRPGPARVSSLQRGGEPHHARRRAAGGAQVHRPAARGGGGGAAARRRSRRRPPPRRQERVQGQRGRRAEDRSRALERALRRQPWLPAPVARSRSRSRTRSVRAAARPWSIR
jgi:hypothetical protein